MINRGGPSFVVRIADQTGASPAAIAFAFAAVRDSYDMPARNDEINALDGKLAGKVQLGLYAAVQDLLLDRVVWFLRNADLTKGLAGVVEHYRKGIAALSDVLLIADRTKKPITAIVATYFAAEAYFRVDRVVTAARGIVVSDYFDRLALDRALDTIGDAERRLTAAMVETGETGETAVQAWIKPRQAEVERIRAAIHQITGSGLTLSKLTVTASLLGDLAKG